MRTSNMTCPAPQADRLAVVVAVVDAIAAGCDTADAISDAIEMTGRQGGYYPNAAWTLGYAEPIPHTSPVQWQLTARGETFAQLATAERTADLADTLLELDEMAVYTADKTGAETLATTWARSGYSEETVARRLQTIGAWAEFLTADPDVQEQSLDAAAARTRMRAPHAKERAVAAKAAKEAAKEAAAKHELVHGELCMSCFITKPVAGDCPTCD